MNINKFNDLSSFNNFLNTKLRDFSESQEVSTTPVPMARQVSGLSSSSEPAAKMSEEKMRELVDLVNTLRENKKLISGHAKSDQFLNCLKSAVKIQDLTNCVRNDIVFQKLLLSSDMEEIPKVDNKKLAKLAAKLTDSLFSGITEDAISKFEFLTKYKLKDDLIECVEHIKEIKKINVELYYKLLPVVISQFPLRKINLTEDEIFEVAPYLERLDLTDGSSPECNDCVFTEEFIGKLLENTKNLRTLTIANSRLGGTAFNLFKNTSEMEFLEIRDCPAFNQPLPDGMDKLDDLHLWDTGMSISNLLQTANQFQSITDLERRSKLIRELKGGKTLLNGDQFSAIFMVYQHFVSKNPAQKTAIEEWMSNLSREQIKMLFILKKGTTIEEIPFVKKIVPDEDPLQQLCIYNLSDNITGFDKKEYSLLKKFLTPIMESPMRASLVRFYDLLSKIGIIFPDIRGEFPGFIWQLLHDAVPLRPAMLDELDNMDEKMWKYLPYLLFNSSESKTMMQNIEHLEKAGLFKTFSKSFPPKKEMAEMLNIENLFMGHKEQDRILFNYLNSRSKSSSMKKLITNLMFIRKSGLLEDLSKIFPPNYTTAQLLDLYDLFTGQEEEDRLMLKLVPYFKHDVSKLSNHRETIMENIKNLEKTKLFETFYNKFPPNEKSAKLLDERFVFTESKEENLFTLNYFPYLDSQLDVFRRRTIMQNIQNLEKLGLFETFLNMSPKDNFEAYLMQRLLATANLFTGHEKEDLLTLKYLPFTRFNISERKAIMQNIQNIEKSGLFETFSKIFIQENIYKENLTKILAIENFFTGHEEQDRHLLRCLPYIQFNIPARNTLIQNIANLEKSGLFETFSKIYPPKRESAEILAIENFFTGNEEKDQHLLKCPPYMKFNNAARNTMVQNIANLVKSGLFETFSKMYPPKKESAEILAIENFFTGHEVEDLRTLKCAPYLHFYSAARNTIIPNIENLEKSGLFETFSKMYPPKKESAGILAIENLFTGHEEQDRQLLKCLPYIQFNSAARNMIIQNIENLEKSGLFETFSKMYPPGKDAAHSLARENLFTGIEEKDTLTLLGTIEKKIESLLELDFAMVEAILKKPAGRLFIEKNLMKFLDNVRLQRILLAIYPPGIPENLPLYPIQKNLHNGVLYLTIIPSMPLDYPDAVMEALKGSNIVNRLSIRHYGGPGIDVGGLGRQFVAQLVQGILPDAFGKSKSEKFRFANGESGGMIPSEGMKLKANKRDNYKELGCFLGLALRLRYPIGEVLSEKLLHCIRTFTVEDLDKEDFTAREFISRMDQESLLAFLSHSAELGQARWEQARQVLLSSDEECLTVVNEMRGIADEDLLESIDSGDIERIRKSYRSNLEDDFENYIEIAHCMAKGLREVLPNEIAGIAIGGWEDLKFVSTPQLSKSLQGRLSTSWIKDNLEFSPKGSVAAVNVQTWMNRWLDEHENDRPALANVVQTFTGARALAAPITFNLTPIIPSLYCHTCFNSADVPMDIDEESLRTVLDSYGRGEHLEYNRS